jgi:hypothetical protein
MKILSGVNKSKNEKLKEDKNKMWASAVPCRWSDGSYNTSDHRALLMVTKMWLRNNWRRTLIEMTKDPEVMISHGDYDEKCMVIWSKWSHEKKIDFILSAPRKKPTRTSSCLF